MDDFFVLFVLDGAQFARQGVELVVCELTEHLAGDAGIKAIFIYYRPIGGVLAELLHELEATAALFAADLLGAKVALKIVTHGVVLLCGHLPEAVGSAVSVLQCELLLLLVAAIERRHIPQDRVKPSVVGYSHSQLLSR